MGAIHDRWAAYKRQQSGTSSSLVWHGPIVVDHTDVTTVQTAQHQKWQVQIVGSPTGGTFVLAPFDDTVSPSDPIAFDADAAAVQAALEAANIDAWTGIVTVTGTNPTFVVEFLDGGPAGYVGKVPMSVLANGLTGGSSPHVTLTETQIGRPLLAGVQVFDPAPGDIVVGAMIHVTETFDGGSPVVARFYSLSDYDSLSTSYLLEDKISPFNSSAAFGGDDSPVIVLVGTGNIGGAPFTHTRGSLNVFIGTATPVSV